MHFLLYSNVSSCAFDTPHPHLLSHFQPSPSCCLLLLVNHHDNPEGKVSLQCELNLDTPFNTAELCAVRVEMTI